MTTEHLPEGALPATPEQPAKPFGAGKAFLAYLLTFLTQFVVSFMIAVVMAFAAVVSGTVEGKDVVRVQTLINQQISLILLASVIANTAVIYGLSRWWADAEMHDQTPSGLGLRAVPFRQVCLGALAGIGLASIYLLVPAFLVQTPPDFSGGPLAKLIQGDLIDRSVWLVLALLYAPPVEEFLFRGLLLKGFARSWGVYAGGVMVTFLFVASHVFEVAQYWPAAVAIFALALATLFVRLKTQSLFPGMAMHWAYNGVIAIFALFFFQQ